jgi:indole-3-glycerol phosphate synthase
MSTILDKIFQVKRSRVERARASTDLDRLISDARQVRAARRGHSLRSALQDGTRINVIAEFKKASPSKGAINQLADPADVALRYDRGGACAISVLTEEDHFGGSLADLEHVRRATSLPILRKDFTFDEFQIYEAAASGADAILLIVAALTSNEIRRLIEVTENELAMDALVEVHTADETATALDAGARLIGVNNRDLRTFNVSLDVSRSLISIIPRDVPAVAESGLRSADEIVELKHLGFAGFLIGETLMRSGDPESELRSLTHAKEANSR